MKLIQVPGMPWFLSFSREGVSPCSSCPRWGPASNEGSYGKATGGLGRPQVTGACKPQCLLS